MNLGRSGIRSLILPALFFALPCTAQQKTTGPGRLLVLPAGIMRLDSLGNMIAQESGFTFSFNAGKISPAKKIVLPASPIRLNTFLAYLDDNYYLACKIYGDHIIIRGKSLLKDPITPTYAGHDKQQVRQEKAAPAKDNRAAEPASKHDVPATKPVFAGAVMHPEPIGQAFLPAITEVSGGGPVSSLVPLTRLYATPLSTTAAAPNDDKNEKKNEAGANTGTGRNKLFVSAGITANEIFYVSPAVKAGVPWLFATAAWRTNFSVSGFSYGVGSSLRLSGTWGIELTADRGSLSNNFGVSSDTLKKIRVKGSLTRIGLAAEKQIGSRWTVSFGPVVNFLKSAYYRDDDQPSASSSLMPVNAEVDRKYYLVKPPYTIRNSYHNDASYTKKIWVGLQVGLFYRLR